MSSHQKPVISLKNIYTAYEGAEYPVIRDVSLDIFPGEFVIIGGPNGAGKTTILETINGLLKITHGEAEVLGMNVSSKGNNIRKRVGYVIQNFAFDPMTPFNVGEIVLMGRYGLIGPLKKTGEKDINRALEAMKVLKIENLKDMPIGKLSGGQQQKALIAQSIAKDPEILLLDEPFSNLDLLTREFVSEMLGEMARKGCTIIIVSHAFDALPDFDIRIVAMNEGRISLDETCSPDEVENKIRSISGEIQNA
ncbi:MAG: ATP-binding cassette domain-containing protein [Methanomicrobiaceae archaeon]|nr:ATP-binding cassette domain-containing protein [Methanomicrobiaceae archaeon]